MGSYSNSVKIATHEADSQICDVFVEEMEDLEKDDEDPESLGEIERAKDSIIEEFIEKSMNEKHDIREQHEESNLDSQ